MLVSLLNKLLAAAEYVLIYSGGASNTFDSSSFNIQNILNLEMRLPEKNNVSDF